MGAITVGRGSVLVHHTATDEGSWDGPANEARLRSGESAGYYRLAYAWQDPDADETTKSAYKFVHHVVSADGEPGAANVRGCQAGIGVLNGARGGADIPDADRQGVWNHLAAHLKDADVAPADLRSLEPDLSAGAGQEIERRFLVGEVRLVEGAEGTLPRITGYGAVFDEMSEDLGFFRESIMPGAFAVSLSRDDIRSLWNHDPNHVLGRNRSQTLRLFEDERGLGYEIDPPDAQWARDLVVSIKRGDVSGSSFGFRVNRDTWSQDEEGNTQRVLHEVTLFDVGPVTFPAYPQTSAQVRAMVHELRGSGTELGQGAGAGAAEAQAQARLRRMRARLDLVDKS